MVELNTVNIMIDVRFILEAINYYYIRNDVHLSPSNYNYINIFFIR